MNKRDYSFKEDDILKYLGEAKQDFSRKAEPVFKNAIPSAIDHTMSLLDTNVINQEIIQDSLNNSFDQGQGQSNGMNNTKEKVRVRTIGGLSPYSTSSSNNSNEPVNNNYQNLNGGYSTDDNSNIWRNGGYTETMILIGTGVLVLLVFMVSYLLLNYFG